MKRSNSGAKSHSAETEIDVDTVIATDVNSPLQGGRATKESVAAIPYADLVARKEEIQGRLQVIAIEPVKAKKALTLTTTATNDSTQNSSGHAKKKSRLAKQQPAGSSISSTHQDNSDQQSTSLSTDQKLEAQQQQEEEAQNVVPMIEKTSDVHWDFTMKEMMWLATDFQGERKRQISLAKKLASAVKQYHKTRESRRQRALAEAELKRRRLAAKLGRDVKGWWTKIERVIAYKQKCSADEERRQAMNKQLVTLVKQTEKYTESLIKMPASGTSTGTDDDDEDASSGDSSYDDQKRRRRRRRKKRSASSNMTIEEALAAGERSRRSKYKVVDYNRFHLIKGVDDHLYGESTASDTGGSSDGSFSLEGSDGHWTDDETTMLEAEEFEIQERALREVTQSRRKETGIHGSSNGEFTADPQELQILKEESNIPVEEVLERYRSEMESTTLAELAEPSMQVNGDIQIEDARTEDAGGYDQQRTRRNSRRNVTFAPGVVAEKRNGDNVSANADRTRPKSRLSAAAAAATKYDADDDGDASDVEDFVDLMDAASANDDSDNGGSEEFEADQDEMDDETTMAQEEKLPQQMSAKEEIDLLNQEQEMPLEELRKMYAGAFQDTSNSNASASESSEETQVAKDAAQPPPVAVAVAAAAAATRATSKRTVTAVVPMDIDAYEVDLEMDDGSVDNRSGSEEFEADQDEVDDETTMEQEERLPQSMTAQEEINCLKAENEISVEELRAKYAGAFAESPGMDEGASDESAVVNDNQGRTKSGRIAGRSSTAATAVTALDNQPSELEQALNSGDDEVAEDEFVPDTGDIVDDETTMEAEERLGRDMTYKQELELLKNENEIPVEQLRAMYASALSGGDLSSVNDAESPESDDDTRLSKKRGASGGSSLALLGSADIEDGGDEDEFEPQAGEEIDDETTMEAEERLGQDMSYADEIALLNQENELSVEELRAKYAEAFGDGADSATNRNGGGEHRLVSVGTARLSALLDDNGSDVGDDTEFVADANEVDDETTMEAEERLGQEMSPEAELAMLKKEGETSIESLYAMYQKMEEENSADAADTMDVDSSESGSVSEASGKRKPASLLDEDDNIKRAKTDGESDDGLAAINALEESAERARRTLASRPFLIAPWVKLREYQQTGLNWLVSMQTRRLNGILADEMGLGKTLQTISLLAYLAAYKGIWGPHLVIVPTSVIVNWEVELKRFCPSLKALCYYGSAKRRKELRTGWTKTNWYHVVVTSYQLAVQDAFAFKRKRWYYLILDEAQNIKNFQSQRWQTLINFNTQRRLLLTGTPLQNNLMELWSLLHFLMPYIFRSRKEFSFWFSNPMNSMIDGTANQNDEMIARLHGIIRPFVLRRLKKDVETQLPGKFEHIVKCPLSRRQMFFYEEFMARSSTRQALKKGGNYMGMMNVLMQLRKVCNHPDLFEPRSVVTPFVLNRIDILVPDCVAEMANKEGVLSKLSPHLLSPLWCGGSATPSIASGVEHDEIRSMALKELEDRLFGSRGETSKSKPRAKANLDIPVGLSKLLLDLDDKAKNDRKATVSFQRDTNSFRCGAPTFLCSARRLRTLNVQQHPIYQKDEDYISTPSQLLALRQSHQDRAEAVDETLKNFVFCVPKAGAARPALVTRRAGSDNENLEEMLLEPLEECLRPFRQAQARLTSFFPDKKLVQFDAGKLQTLSELLHNLKRGGHRVLIFTQMSKMLDILEAFLNLNGHTYVRLDGSTGVDRRQRLMDRFNNDTKIFSFILSTRSGGMGINLTGADTVIFYDSDWNPAMDAQAQDRAHRIGQTREVHIYRLITEHSIEENILVKAQQKRNLDILVMDRGKFDGAGVGGHNDKEEKNSTQNDQSDVFTKGGLRAILGVDDKEQKKQPGKGKDEGDGEVDGENLTKEQIEAAMTNLEDQDDVLALRGAQKEAKEELQEFDESIELKEESDNDEGDGDAGKKTDAAPKPAPKKKEEAVSEQKNEEDEMAKEFAAWQDNVGLDTSALEASLSPTETYALNFRQEIDPFYSMFAVLEERRRIEAAEETKEELDIDQIEHEKAMEERRAIEDGDLLATRPRPEDLVRQRTLYEREKARLKANKKRRKLTGENWELREDSRNNKPFWYNTDTGEALWDKPTVLLELEAEDLAREKLWSGLPIKPLVHIMSFLVPCPDRVSAAHVCFQWRQAANDISFVRHVYPVEMGAILQDNKYLGHNHFRTIADALAIALPGDTVELGDGHYWVSEPGLSIEIPLRFVGDENNASNVVVELSGTISWSGKAGWVEGVTFRRPKMSSGEGSKDDILRILDGGKIDMVHSVVDNTGSTGASAIAVQGAGAGGRWQNVVVSGGSDQGVILEGGAKVEMKKCIIRGSKGNGIVCNNSEVHVVDSTVTDNGSVGAIIRGGAAKFAKCKFYRNAKGILEKHDGCKVNCNHNTAPASVLARHGIPGFQAATGE